MDKFLYNTSLGVYNRARRLVGRRWINPKGFNVSVPDERINRMFRLVVTEVEDRLSLPFGIKLRSRWLQSSANRAEAYVMESAHVAELIAYYDTSLAKEILAPFIENQTVEGNIPMYVRPMGTSRSSAGPYLFNTLWLLQRMGETEDVQILCDRMSRLANWLMMHKKNVEGLFTHGNSNWFRTAPCLTELRRTHPDIDSTYDEVRSVAFNSLVAMQMRVMSKIAMSCGRERDANLYEDTAVKLSERMNEIFWDEDSGFYYDLAGESPMRDISLSGFLPTAGEVSDKRQVERMMEFLPMISDRRSLVNSSPGMTPMFRLVVDGLVKYGRQKEAANIALSVVEHIADLDEVDKYFLPRTVSLLLLINEIAGFNKFKDRYVLFPKIPEKWVGSPVRIYDGDTNIRINLTLGSDEKVSVMMSDPSGMLYEKNIPNYSFTNISLPIK